MVGSMPDVQGPSVWCEDTPARPGSRRILTEVAAPTITLLLRILGLSFLTAGSLAFVELWWAALLLITITVAVGLPVAWQKISADFAKALDAALVGMRDSMPSPTDSAIVLFEQENLGSIEMNQLSTWWRSSLEAFALAIDGLEEILHPVVTVTRDHRIQTVNHSACALFGFANSGQLVGSSVDALIAGQFSAVSDLLQLNGKAEIDGKRADGSVFAMEVEVTADRADSTIALLLKDLTRENEMQSALRAARDTALETALMQHDFLANMSHELRTPINGILGMTEMAAELSVDPEQRQHLESIMDCGDGLLTIVNEILDFSKLEAGKVIPEFHPYAPRVMGKKILQLIAPKAEANGNELLMTVDEDLPEWILGDELRVRQILANFASNAAKFTETGKIELILRVENDRIVFEITDSGIGIPNDKLNAVFEKFAQASASTTRKYGGTGLGLAICRQLATVLDGEVGVRSVVGEGSTFFLCLPLRAATPPQQSEEHTLLENISIDFAQFRILVAEDNPINQKITARHLKRLGCTSTIVKNGAEAAREASTGKYDLVLMDVMMPEVGGHEGTRMIRDKEQEEGRSQVPIIALTANVMESDRQNCLDAGMNDHLAKPISQAAILQILAKWLVDRSSEAA